MDYRHGYMRIFNWNEYRIEMYYDNNYNLLNTVCFNENMERHCHNGPAVVHYNKGEITCKEYFLNGKQIRDELQIMIIESDGVNG